MNFSESKLQNNRIRRNCFFFHVSVFSSTLNVVESVYCAAAVNVVNCALVFANLRCGNSQRDTHRQAVALSLRSRLLFPSFRTSITENFGGSHTGPTSTNRFVASVSGRLLGEQKPVVLEDVDAQRAHRQGHENFCSRIAAPVGWVVLDSSFFPIRLSDSSSRRQGPTKEQLMW